MEVLDYVMFAVMHMVTPEMVKAKVLQAEGKYGPLDFSTWNPGTEALQEVIDLFAYCHASRFSDVPKA